MDKPFRILGVNHIAIGTSDRQKMQRLWVEVFGGRLDHSFSSRQENVEEDVYLLGEQPYQVQIDIMEPIDSAKSPGLTAFPLNHIGLWIDDLRAAFEWMTSNGIRFTLGGIRKGSAGHDVCFIHPKSNENFPISGEGVLVELVQAPLDLLTLSKQEYLGVASYANSLRNALRVFRKTSRAVATP